MPLHRLKRVAMRLRRHVPAAVDVQRAATMVAAATRAPIAMAAATRSFHTGCIAAANCSHASAGAIAAHSLALM